MDLVLSMLRIFLYSYGVRTEHYAMDLCSSAFLNIDRTTY
jgi:hypothetical protein